MYTLHLHLLLYDYCRLAVRQTIFSTHPVKFLQWISPLPGENLYTRNTNPMTHTDIYILLCTVSTCNPAHSSPLLPLSSSFLIFLFVCAMIGRSFVIQQIPSSNLFMVVVDNKCDCSMFEPITMNPIEIMYILHWSKT